MHSWKDTTPVKEMDLEETQRVLKKWRRRMEETDSETDTDVRGSRERKVRRSSWRKSPDRRDRGYAVSAKNPPTSTESVQNSGRRPTKPEPRTPLPSDRTGSWRRPLHSWETIKDRFNLNHLRYESLYEFEYLRYIESHDDYIKNYVDYQLGRAKPIFKGRLKNSLEFWKTLNPPTWIENIVEKGITVQFINEPPVIFLPNNKSAILPEHKDWIRKNLLEFESYGFIERVPEIPYCTLPLQVVTHSEKLSLT